jgi:hypothetical protein
MADQTQTLTADRIKLVINAHGESAQSIFIELIRQASSSKDANCVALGVVGASLCLGLQYSSRLLAYTETIEFIDLKLITGFRLNNCLFLVEIGRPSVETLEKIRETLKLRGLEVWLLTREDRVASWKNEISNLFGKRVGRFVVTSVESFVGQSITELASFSASAKIERITELVDLYNHRWADAVGAPSIQILNLRFLDGAELLPGS